MFGISAITERPGIASAARTTSSASTNCGTTFGGTKEVTSISRTPAAASARIHASFCSVGKKDETSCRPSRSPTSHTRMSMGKDLRATSFPPEQRLAFFVEGAHAFVAVLGVDEPVVGFDCEAKAGEKVRIEPVVDRLLRLAHRKRPVLADRLRRSEEHTS